MSFLIKHALLPHKVVQKYAFLPPKYSTVTPPNFTFLCPAKSQAKRFKIFLNFLRLTYLVVFYFRPGHSLIGKKTKPWPCEMENGENKFWFSYMICSIW